MSGVINSCLLSRFRCVLIFLFAVLLYGVSADAREVTLQWDPNSEPDLSHYVVLWGSSSGSYSSNSGDIGLSTSYTCSLPDNGQVYYFAVIAVNEAGLSSDYSNEVSTGGVTGNGAPVAIAGPDQNVNEGSRVYLDASNAYDPDGDVISYQWIQTGGSSVTLDDSAAVRPSFTAPSISSQGESLTFELTVTDSEGLQSKDTCIVNIVSVNLPPSADAGPDQNVNEGLLVYLDGSNSSDPDGDSLTYQWLQTGGPYVSIDDPASAQPVFDSSYINSEGDSLTFQLTVFDEIGLQSTDTCIVNIISVNNPPASDAGPDQNVKEGSTVYLNGANSSDPDGDSLKYQWSQTGGPAVILNDPRAAQPSFTSPFITSRGESLVFQLTVTDEGGLGSTDSCTVNIVSVNNPPAANAGSDQTVIEGTRVTLDGSGSIDPDGDVLSFRWIQTGGTPVTLSSSITADPVFEAFFVDPEGESLTFQLTVTDKDGLQSTDTCIVNITWVNDPPVSNAGPDQNINEGSSVTLDGSGSSDPDGDLLTYQWSQKGGPAAVLNDPRAAQPSFNSPYVTSGGESLIFQLTVTDEGGLQSTDSCTVNILSLNNPPVANAGTDQTVQEGGVVTLDGSGSSDPDGDSLSYIWAQESGPDLTLSDSGTIRPTFRTPDVGVEGAEAVFNLTVTDAGGLESTDSCRVSISWVNEAPSANAGPDQTVDEGTDVILNGSGSSDPDGEILSYTWVQISGPPVTLNDDGTGRASFQAPDVAVSGEYLTFELNVTDPDGARSNDRCIISILSVNEAPMADAGLDQTVDPETVVVLNGSNSSDPDDEILSYLWSQTSGPAVDLSDPTAVNPGFTAGTEGSMTFMLTVTDAGGLQASDSCIVNVSEVSVPPIADAGIDQAVSEGDATRLDGSGSTDPDGGVLSYQWTQTSGTAVTLSDPAAADPYFTAPPEGSLTFTLTVIDADGLKSSDMCIVNVVHINQPPAADGGSDQYVQEGVTVVLDASGSTDPDDGILSYLWTQTGGTAVTLSDSTDYAATFVAPPVSKTDMLLTFDLTVTDNSGLMSTTSMNITVTDNGITAFPDNVTSIMSETDMPVGITVDSGGACTSLETVDPLPLLDKSDAPDVLPYGLLNFRIKVNRPGDTAVVNIYLPEAAGEDYSWYKYDSSAGWEDFGEHAVLSPDRNRVTLTLVDGGPGDEDKLVNGEIVDPSGPGLVLTSSSDDTRYAVKSAGKETGGGSVDAGCFITTSSVDLFD